MGIVLNCITYTPQKKVILENECLSLLCGQIAQPGLLHPGATVDPAHSSAVGGTLFRRDGTENGCGDMEEENACSNRRVAAAGRLVGEKVLHLLGCGYKTRSCQIKPFPLFVCFLLLVFLLLLLLGCCFGFFLAHNH